MEMLGKLALEACFDSVCLQVIIPSSWVSVLYLDWKLMTHLILCFCIRTLIIPAMLTASRSIGSPET